MHIPDFLPRRSAKNSDWGGDLTYNPNDLQGNILRGYRYERVRYLILEVANRAAARNFLARSAEGNSPDVPAITSAAKWDPGPEANPVLQHRCDL